MEPQVNKILSRLGKAEKTELKSEKVELGLIQDLEALNKEIRKEITSAYAPFPALFGKIQSVAKSELKKINSLIARGESELKRVQKIEKELGITVYGKGTTPDLERNIEYMKSDVRRQIGLLTKANQGDYD